MIDMIARNWALLAIANGAPDDAQVQAAVSALAEEGKINAGATKAEAEQIDQNKNNILELEKNAAQTENILNIFFSISQNMFNPDTVTPDLIVSADGVETSSNNWDTSDYIALPYERTYIYIISALEDEATAHYNVSLYDEHKAFLVRRGFATKVVATDAATQNGNAKYIRLSHKHASDIMVLLSDTVFNTDIRPFVAYGKYIKDEVLPKWIHDLDETIQNTMSSCKMTYVYVSSTGSDTDGDGSADNPFATIYYANETIQDASEKKQYTIVVKQGTYTDLQSRFSGMNVSDFNEKYQGIVCKDYVYYESEDISRPELTVIEWDGSDGLGTGLVYSESVYTKCPFHITGQLEWNPNGLHTHVKGFTFNVSNCRYCFHTESGNCGLNVDWLVENCIFNWGGRPAVSSGDTNSFVVGSGLSPFEKGKFKNCKFCNSSGDLGWYGHDGIFKSTYGYTPAMLPGALIEFENCSFDDLIVNTQSLRAGALFDTYNLCRMTNCRGISALNYTFGSGNTDNSWRIITETCEIVNDNRG